MLAKALQESLNAESLPRQNGETPPSPPRPVVIPPNGRRYWFLYNFRNILLHFVFIYLVYFSNFSP